MTRKGGRKWLVIYYAGWRLCSSLGAHLLLRCRKTFYQFSITFFFIETFICFVRLNSSVLCETGSDRYSLRLAFYYPFGVDAKCSIKLFVVTFQVSKFNCISSFLSGSIQRIGHLSQPKPCEINYWILVYVISLLSFYSSVQHKIITFFFPSIKLNGRKCVRNQLDCCEILVFVSGN